MGRRRDPARTIALLWGPGAKPAERAQGPRTRGPAQSLSTAVIAAAAIGLADSGGLAALSMRRVATHLDVSAMTLYTYVQGKADLLDLMLDTVLASSYDDAPEIDPRDWRGGVRAIADTAWRLVHRHPWVVEVPRGRPVLGPGETARYERDLRGIEASGLDDVELDVVVAQLTTLAEGAARRSVDMTRVQRESGLTDTEWWEVNAPLLEQVLDPAVFPLATRVGSTVGQELGAALSPRLMLDDAVERIVRDLELRCSTG